MNGGSLSEARTRVIKKAVFLFVLALVALAYVATPVLACGGAKGGNNAKGGKNAKGGNGVAAATDQQALADLKAGLNETFSVTLSSLKPGDKFKITFKDGIVLDAIVDTSGLTATVTLPSGNQQKGVQLLNGKVILSNTPLSTTQSDKQTITDLENAFSSEKEPGGGIQLLNRKINGGSLKPGQQFRIKLIRSDLILNAEYLGNKKFTIDPNKASALSTLFISNSTKARVTFPDNTKITLPIVP